MAPRIWLYDLGCFLVAPPAQLGSAKLNMLRLVGHRLAQTFPERHRGRLLAVVQEVNYIIVVVS